MSDYDVVYDYTDLGGNGNIEVIKRKYVFFGLIPTLDWELVHTSDTKESCFDWINENIVDSFERVDLKLKINSL